MANMAKRQGCLGRAVLALGIVSGILTVRGISDGPSRAWAEATSNFVWERVFTPETFQTAAREKRLVILDLEAVWCHWCHVMDEKTYARDDIAKLIREKYIAVRVDQDARPDLSNRYRDYGWPATIIFNEKGEELEKLSGFVEPEEMKRILEAAVANPVPSSVPAKVAYAEKSGLDESLRKELIGRFQSTADRGVGGLKTSHKYLDSDTVEYAIRKGAEGDQSSADFAKKTLDGNLKLIDPVWGGVYQYSTHGDWDHAHFEKLVSKQATDLRLYSIAWTVWHEERHRKAMEDIWKYLEGFLHDSSGAYYVSQDADVVKGEHSAEYFELGDAARRKQGIPAVDKHLYANENGRIATALATAYGATGERKFLLAATGAAEWILANRRRPGGGFSHGDSDPAGPYLGDTLYAGQAFLTLYGVTGDRRWLGEAERAAEFIDKTFRARSGAPGFLTAQEGSSVLPSPALLAENIAITRFLSSLEHYSGKKNFRSSAEFSMRLAATESFALETISEPGILMADEELSNPPLHVTIVGAKGDTTAQALFAEAIRYPRVHKRTEWWDRAEGAMPNADVQYPPLPKAAAFVCTDKRCSLPIFQPPQVAETVRRLTSNSGM